MPCTLLGRLARRRQTPIRFSIFRNVARAIGFAERNDRKFRFLVSRVGRSPNDIFKLVRPSPGGTVGLIAEPVPRDERVSVWTLAVANVYYDWFGPKRRLLQLVVLAVIGDGYILGQKFLDEFRAL